MPLFKEEKYNVKGTEYKIRYNVDADGRFWCAIKPDMMQATGLQEKEYADTFKALESRVCDAIDKWKEFETVRTYHIKFRLCLSSAVRRKIPDDVMYRREDVDLWKKTSRLGSEYFPDDASCMIFDWIPVVREVEGELEHEIKLQLASEDTFHMRQAIEAWEKGETPHSFHTSALYKPFEKDGDETIFESDGNYWNFNDDYYIEIPLTPDTWKFFSSIDETFVKLFTSMLSFLSEDPKKLEERITVMVQAGNMNLLGEK